MNDSFHAFLELHERDRRDVFAAGAERLGTLPQYVEKDFWVCFVLDLLFAKLPRDHPSVFFKGGTSLSKAFDAIHRLSEDIDLVVDRRDLGFTGECDPFLAGDMSNKRRSHLMKELRKACAAYVDGALKPSLKALTGDLTPGCAVSFRVADQAEPPLLMTYPTLYPGGPTEYVAPTVKIEAGARSATEPRVTLPIVPFIAQDLEDANLRTRNVEVISARRTYWEKALILHGVFCGFRDEGRRPGDTDRVSRHYYDTAVLTDSEIGRSALEQCDLLDSVRGHNLIAFRQKWRRFEEAVPGSLRLVPYGQLKDGIRRDYQAMQSMFFGDSPEFDWILEQLRSAEERINAS